MNELLTVISFWCGIPADHYSVSIVNCKKSLLTCVVADLRPQELNDRFALSVNLMSCLTQKAVSEQKQRQKSRGQ